MEGRLWYDAKMKEIDDISMNLKYTRQCWGINLEFVKRPGDYSVVVMFDLKGLSKSLKI
jgi:hypothetical protein